MLTAFADLNDDGVPDLNVTVNVRCLGRNLGAACREIDEQVRGLCVVDDRECSRRALRAVWVDCGYEQMIHRVGMQAYDFRVRAPGNRTA